MIYLFYYDTCVNLRNCLEAAESDGEHPHVERRNSIPEAGVQHSREL